MSSGSLSCNRIYSQAALPPSIRLIRHFKSLSLSFSLYTCRPVTTYLPSLSCSRPPPISVTCLKVKPSSGAMCAACH